MQTSVIELNKKGLDAATWDFLNKWLSGFLTKERETLNLSPLEKCDLDEDLQKWLISNDIKDT